MLNVYQIVTARLEPFLSIELEAFVDANIGEFLAVMDKYKGRRDGSISNIEAFWLYFMVKAIKPLQIIESGTLHGYSLHYIAEAAQCPIHSFDIDQSKSEKRLDVYYHECDWTASPMPLATGKGTLVFFDDHIDHDRRLAEARKMGQEHVFFHDNYIGNWFSHKALRFCGAPDAVICTELPNYRGHEVFRGDTMDGQTYRWLTYLRLPI